MTAGVIGHVLHFQHAHLIKTSSKEVNYVTVVCGALGEIVVELKPLLEYTTEFYRLDKAYLDSLLEIFDVVPINVVMRSDRLLQLWTDNNTGTLGCWATSEDHDASTCILERRFQQPNSNADSDTGTSQGTLIVSNWPGITLQLLKDVGDLEFGLLYGEKESSRRTHGRRHATRLLRSTGTNASIE
jgi:hypothetical protein